MRLFIQYTCEANVKDAAGTHGFKNSRVTATARRALTALLLLGVSGSALWYAAAVFPLGQDEEPLVTANGEPRVVRIAPGESYSFPLEVPALTIKGFTFFAKEFSPGGKIALEVRDSTTGTLQRGFFWHTRTHETSTRVIFPLFYGSTRAHDVLTITLTRISGDPLLLAATENSTPVTAVAIPRLLTAAERQGVAASVAIALLLLLAYVTPTSRVRWLVVSLTLLLVPLLAINSFWLSPRWGIGDWDYRFGLHHIFRTTVMHFHQFPLWNPYTCGGAAGIGDPEFSVLTPAFLLELFFGVPRGTKIAIYFGVLITSFGMLRLAKSLKLSWLASFTTALLATYSSAYILKIAEGHVTIVYAFMWVPWALWAWLMAYRNAAVRAAPVRWPLVAGIFMTLMLFQGGMYVLLYFGVVLLFLCGAARRTRLAVHITLQSSLWFLGLGSVKLLPNLYWLSQFPDQTFASSTTTLPFLIDIFLRRYLHGSYVIPDQLSGWHEYGAYIGYFALSLALLGSSLFTRSRTVRLLAVGTFAAIVASSLGPRLADEFARLPFIPRSNISRVSLFAVLGIALLAGYGSDVLRGRFRKHYWFLLICIMLLSADVLTLASAIADQTFVVQPLPPLAAAPWPIAYTTNKYAVNTQGQKLDRTYAAALAGYGTFSFCAVLGPSPSVQKVGDSAAPPYLTLTEHSGAARVSEWSPNQFTIESELARPTEAVINANYAPGWHASVGSVYARHGRLAIVLPDSTASTTLRYRPPLLRTGIAVSFGTVLAAFALHWHYRQRAKAADGYPQSE